MAATASELCVHGCRVQELVRHVGDTDTPIQLWDVSGDARYKPYWPILAKVRTTRAPCCTAACWCMATTPPPAA